MSAQFTRSEFEQALPVLPNGLPLWKPLSKIDGRWWYEVQAGEPGYRILVKAAVGDEDAIEGGVTRVVLQGRGQNPTSWSELVGSLIEVPNKEGWCSGLSEAIRMLRVDAASLKAQGQRSAVLSFLDEDEGKDEGVDSERGDFLDELLDELGLSPQHEDRLVTELANRNMDWWDGMNNTPTRAEQRVILRALVEQMHDKTRVPNALQTEAITAPADAAVRVLAPPGSGKTFLVARRIAWLLKQGADPGRILVVTYSKDMAAELKRRIRYTAPHLAGSEIEEQICTIHAACLRMLRAEGDRRRVAKHWELKSAVQDAASKYWSHNPPGWTELWSIVDTVKEQGYDVGPDALVVLDSWIASANASRIMAAWEHVDAKFQEEGVFTFADMLLEVELRLRHDKDFRDKYQQRFEWIVVDEGQDTNAQAMRILTTLASPQDRFFIVGDPNQLLYRFVGAAPEHNLHEGFEKRFPSAASVGLSVNYRSRTSIIDTANMLIANNYGGYGRYDDRYRQRMVGGPGAQPGLRPTYRMFTTQEAEAQRVVASIGEQISRGRKPDEFFVGARTRAQLAYLEEPLVDAGIPYVNSTGGSFWALAHVQHVLSYVRVLEDPHDAEAFSKVYNVGSNTSTYPWGPLKGQYCPHRYLGHAFLKAVKDPNGQATLAQAKVLFGSSLPASSARFRPGLVNMLAFYQGYVMRFHQGSATPLEAIKYVRSECYDKWLEHEEDALGAGSNWSESKSDDIDALESISAQFPTMDKFLAFIERMMKTSRAAHKRDWNGVVVLSTVHGLKGLERNVVYGIGFCEGSDFGLMPHTFSIVAPTPRGQMLLPPSMTPMADERCIAYVLVTRARHELHLSGFSSKKNVRLRPSRFVEEMGLLT